MCTEPGGRQRWLGEGSDGWVKARCAGATRWCTPLSPALHVGWAGVSLKDNVAAPKSSPSSKRQPHNPKVNFTASVTTVQPKDNSTALKTTPQPQSQPYSSKANPTAQRQPHSPKTIPLPQRQPHSSKDNPTAPKATPLPQRQPPALQQQIPGVCPGTSFHEESVPARPRTVIAFHHGFTLSGFFCFLPDSSMHDAESGPSCGSSLPTQLLR